MTNSLPQLGSLADRIKWARERKKWSQAELAKRIGIDQTAVSLLEKGGIKNPRNIEKIGKELGVSPAWLQYGISDLDKLTRRGIDIALKFESLSEGDQRAVQAILDKF